MEILEGIIQILVAIVAIMCFVFIIIFLIKKDENFEFVVTDKQCSIVSLFLLPVLEVMFILSTIDNILANDMPLVVFNLIFVVSIPVLIFLFAKIFKNK